MQFGQPQFLIIGLILIPVVALFLLWARRKQRKAINALGNDELIARLSADTNWRGRRWRTLLRLLALTFLVIALAGLTSVGLSYTLSTAQLQRSTAPNHENGRT